jgi:hypothetical protein
MKTKLLLTATVSSFFILHSAFGQGALTPPGAPAATMKTLAQIEPRTDVLKLGGDATHLFVITNAGSYYLTTNILGAASKYGIEIMANNVTLDLDGFTLTGVAGASSGILIPGAYTNITIRNGNLVGWPNNAVQTFSPNLNLTIEGLKVTASGGSSIFVSGALISGCAINGSGVNGITGANNEVRNCSINNSGGYGILSAGTVTGCTVANSVSSGIYVTTPGSVIAGNICTGNNTSGSATDAGIYVAESNNRIENNHVTASGYAGIKVNTAYTNNVVIKNSVAGNGGNNYIGTAFNDFGPIGTAATTTSPWANISH